jgi:hypothetical protein
MPDQQQNEQALVTTTYILGVLVIYFRHTRQTGDFSYRKDSLTGRLHECTG